MRRGPGFALLLAIVTAVPSSAQQRPPQPPSNGATQAAPRPSGPYRPFAELTKDAVTRLGFFDTYQKEDRLYLAVPWERLGTDFLMEMKIARGIGAGGLYGGTMLNLFEGNLVTLERHGEQIYLLQRPHRFTAATNEAAARAVDLTFGASVLETAKIESVREDSALVIDVAGWFVSDLSGISQAVRQAVGRPGPVGFDRQRSYLESVKAFPQNVNVRAKLTFRPQEPVDYPSVPDGRYLPISIHYTLAALPEQPMAVRRGDDRIGNFWTVHKDFSQDDSTSFVRLVNRWRLEPGERVGDKWRPKRPIVYYIDPNVPIPYRAAMKAGVEAWNGGFAAAGFVDAIRAEDLPEGADPEDIRYATLRWNVSDQPGYGAIGPSTVDPRTGEVLDADVLFESTFFGGFRDGWRWLAGSTSAALALERALAGASPDQGGTELPGLADVFASSGSLLHAALVARGEIGARDPVPESYVAEAVTWATMHEVGHTLGLQHNFRSSGSTPNAKLHDRAWALANGLYGSVMEYPSVNLAPKGVPNGFYYTPTIGSYDRWAIAYGYTPDDNQARAIARESATPAHLFGANSESAGAGASDPSVNIWDLGDDPLGWARERTAMIRDLLRTLPEHTLADNTPYLDVTNGYLSLISQYADAIAPAVKYLGGQYINRDHHGDPAGRLPFENVPKAKQQEALDLLVDRVFAPSALALPPAVLQRMGPNRWNHWGSNTTFGGRVDFPYHEQTLGFQTAMLGQVLNPLRLARIRDGETKYGAAAMVTIPELMGALTKAVWSEVGTAPVRTIEPTRRDLQRAYLDQMTRLLVDPPSRTPADARAHLEESRARIHKALTAGLEAERR